MRRCYEFLGFVPFSFSKRVLKEYGVEDRTPESPVK
jgi:hypothetical protein